MKPTRPKLRPDHPCMAIATERDLCGKPTSPNDVVVVVIGKSFVLIELCRKHAPKRAP